MAAKLVGIPLILISMLVAIVYLLGGSAGIQALNKPITIVAENKNDFQKIDPPVFPPLDLCQKLKIKLGIGNLDYPCEFYKKLTDKGFVLAYKVYGITIATFEYVKFTMKEVISSYNGKIPEFIKTSFGRQGAYLGYVERCGECSGFKLGDLMLQNADKLLGSGKLVIYIDKGIGLGSLPSNAIFIDTGTYLYITP